MIASIDPVSRKTPTLGRKHSILSDIFSNVGTVGTGMPGGGAPTH